MIYQPWSLPLEWKWILHSLEEKPKTFQELLRLGIKRDRLKEILGSMKQLGMIEDSRGGKYALKHKGDRLKC